MIDDRKTICLIPAKGGSTRLARKNILPLGGKPLLGWTIESAMQSGLMDRIVVSTEDLEIADTARSLGADVPFIRPEQLARDPAGVVDVALHALGELRSRGEEYQVLVILLPTCPFRNSDDIRSACELFLEKRASFLMSVSRYDHTPFAAMKLDRDQGLSPFFPEYIGKKSQEMPAAYRSNGAIHVLEVKAFERERSYYAQPLIGYEMPWQRSIDIDTEFDLRFAESLLAREAP